MYLLSLFFSEFKNVDINCRLEPNNVPACIIEVANKLKFIENYMTFTSTYTARTIRSYEG